MSLNFTALSEAPIIELDSIDSTNNYAMQLIDADTAQPGLTITALQQTHGKGQRGRTWNDTPGSSLLMSIITTHPLLLNHQFQLIMATAVAVAVTLQDLYEQWDVRIKWPNDIIVNDKKAGGILIENVIRGNNWLYSIIGLGLNVKQESFPIELPHATSLKIASGIDFDLKTLRDKLRLEILEQTAKCAVNQDLLKQYNGLLYRKGNVQGFADAKESWEAIIIAAAQDGTLHVQLPNGSIVPYTHGMVTWTW
ncbi:MAG: biotin--[acetyl-CoA-carboxylase] ligase [Flavipsychrobacter sp.]|nr:biotin--[acetyl-CoA-carboxylase] ligase [Flavipsychrobacter sp.]